MPIIDRRDASDVHRYIDRIFGADSADERTLAIRRLFSEKLDFDQASGEVSLADAPANVDLPAAARRVASLEGVQVVYVDLSETGTDTNRVRKAEASTAARLVYDQLDGDLLLVFTNRDASQLHLVYPSFERTQPTLRRMIVERDLPRRTAVQQVSNIFHEWQARGSLHAALEAAFDVEAVTARFFAEYKRVFDAALDAIGGFGASDDGRESCRLFTQTLFNRLMFVYFLSRKGWLSFEGKKDYLNALWDSYKASGDETNFYNSRLAPLFFAGLNNQQSRDLRRNNPVLFSLIGAPPFLNGGLFEKGKLDNRNGVTVPDSAVRPVLTDLFEKFNFTVIESTPYDVEVAVDPEMLGKVFEELVTGRHTSGSYYTPRPVVSFMCREALKGYLAGLETGLDADAVAKFVDERDTSGISLAAARRVGQALDEVTVVDPACGSGAYLLGMMQELVELQTALYSDRLSASARDLYHLKLHIIQRSLYGVDIDGFAVNIAMLRLWLSLAIDYDGSTPEPLPNLDFKIVCGDSLLGPDPSPDSYGDLFRHQVNSVASRLADLKAEYMAATEGKDALRAEIESVQGLLTAAVADSPAPAGSVDWRVEFAEVFQRGGFNVVVANPPYGAKVSSGARDLYFDRKLEGAQSGDTYGLFIARGLQLMSPGGRLCYIVSDMWRTLKSHLPLRRRILRETTVAHILDLPSWIFEATVNTCIVSLAKRTPDASHCLIAGDLRGILPNDWQSLESNLVEVSTHDADKQTRLYARYTYTQKLIESYENLPFFIGSPQIFNLMMADPGLIALGDIAESPHGISTGANKKYIRAEPGTRGNYPQIESWMKMSDREMRSLSGTEKIKGVKREWTELTECFVPFDKGVPSNAKDGWLPNYYVPTPYYINWAEGSIADMKKNRGNRSINQGYFFRQGLTFSISGQYAPTFRLNSEAVFEAKESGIFTDQMDREVLMGILASKAARYQFKVFIKHTVDTSGDDVKRFRIPIPSPRVAAELKRLVGRIVERQKGNPDYPYHLHEQRVIDDIVYDLYGLDFEDILEIETWYCRRYPALAKAQGVALEGEIHLSEEEEDAALVRAIGESMLETGTVSEEEFLAVLSEMKLNEARI